MRGNSAVLASLLFSRHAFRSLAIQAPCLVGAMPLRCSASQAPCLSGDPMLKAFQYSSARVSPHDFQAPSAKLIISAISLARGPSGAPLFQQDGERLIKLKRGEKAGNDNSFSDINTHEIFPEKVRGRVKTRRSGYSSDAHFSGTPKEWGVLVTHP